ncbi:MAG: glutaredoxin family protein [Acidobacteria bacterium]|nr:glutaredoxin family protein [Acidobacteriota bacterium]
MTLTLYSKPGCHLCEELRNRLDELQPQFGFALSEIDITRDAELFARFRYGIPVLFRAGKEIARGRVADHELLMRLGK